ncbi:hypothetical protein FRX31_009076, partial [Thalictrum thalictroides]
MSASQIISTKLKGTENYALWALRMTAYLRRQGLKDIIESDEVSDETNENALADIELCLEDGPLLQIQHIKRAHILWQTLKNLYTPKGFSADFFIIKEFFNCKLSNFNNMEEFLNTSRRLLDSMQQRGIELPKQVIFTQYLNNLSNNYENIVSNIMQTLRNNFDSYTLDELFSNLLDEANRLQSKIDSSETALILASKRPTKFKSKKQYKVTKGMLCRHCSRTNHNTADCFDLFPEKAPKKWKRALQSATSSISNNQLQKSDVVNNDENLLMSHEDLPLISYEDCNIENNVSQVTPITVLTLQSADMSSDVVNIEKDAMLRLPLSNGVMRRAF